MSKLEENLSTNAVNKYVYMSLILIFLFVIIDTS